MPKGVPLSLEHRAKISAGCKGKHAGPNSYLWRGGTSEEDKLLRRSFPYKEWRRHVYQRDDYTCQACGKRGGRLQADHELPFAHFPDLRLEILNGRTLCVPCHKLTPTYGWRAKGYDYPQPVSKHL